MSDASQKVTCSVKNVKKNLTPKNEGATLPKNFGKGIT